MSIVKVRSRLNGFLSWATLALLVVLLNGCATHSISDTNYLNQTPGLDIESFFDGDVRAWGIVQNRKGKIVQRFTVDISGSKQGDKLVLDETFHYAVGEGPAKRIWELQRKENGQWSGEAGDIVGSATGVEFGNAFNWHYQMELPMPGSSRKVTVLLDDWMWALDQNTLMNRSYIRKFGMTFAEVTIFMQRQPSGS